MMSRNDFPEFGRVLQIELRPGYIADDQKAENSASDNANKSQWKNSGACYFTVSIAELRASVRHVLC
jgi:hypothetical protein